MKTRMVFMSLFILVVGCVIVSGLLPSEPDEPLLELLIKNAVCTSEARTYENETFGFRMRYPQCFHLEADSQSPYQDYAKADLWVHDVRITMECYATFHDPVRKKDGFVMAEPMEKGDTAIHLSTYMQPTDQFSVTAPYPNDSGEYKDYLYHALYIRRQHVWFVLSLIYPREYDSAVRRLTKWIDEGPFFMP